MIVNRIEYCKKVKNIKTPIDMRYYQLKNLRSELYLPPFSCLVDENLFIVLFPTSVLFLINYLMFISLNWLNCSFPSSTIHKFWKIVTKQFLSTASYVSGTNSVIYLLAISIDYTNSSKLIDNYYRILTSNQIKIIYLLSFSSLAISSNQSIHFVVGTII